jgi:hypothetical protein
MNLYVHEYVTYALYGVGTAGTTPCDHVGGAAVSSALFIEACDEVASPDKLHVKPEPI